MGETVLSKPEVVLKVNMTQRFPTSVWRDVELNSKKKKIKMESIVAFCAQIQFSIIVWKLFFSWLFNSVLSFQILSFIIVPKTLCISLYLLNISEA